MPQTVTAPLRSSRRSSAASYLHGDDPKQVGRYRVIRKLGQGGMGAVYLAQDPTLVRYVAIKSMRTNLLLSRSGVKCSLHEAQVLARLSHPNVVQMYEAIEDEEHIYLVMEYIAGENLATWMRSRTRGAKGVWKLIVRRLVEAGRGIDAAHRRGILHCDIKPENVLIREDEPRAQVADFGLARIVAGSESDTTRELQVSDMMHSSTEKQPIVHMIGVGETLPGGTPGYIAPEVVSGERPSARSDQYSYCVCVWWCLTGQLTLNLSREDERLVPAKLKRILRRGMSVNPQHRWASMEALLGEMALLIEGRNIGMPTAFIGAVGVAGAMYLGLQGAGPTPCSGASQDFRAIWSEEQQAETRGVFQRVFAQPGTLLANRFVSQAHNYATRWAKRRTDICQEHLRNERSDQIYARSLRCFDDAKRKFEKLVLQMNSTSRPASREFLYGAGVTLASLPEFSRCTDLQLLQGDIDVPDSPTAAAEALRISDGLAEANALVGAVVFSEVVTLLEVAVGRARDLGHSPVLAKTLREAGAIQIRMGKVSEARVLLDEALDLAESEGYDLIAALAWRDLMRTHVELDEDPKQGEQWLRRLGASVNRLGRPPVLERDVLWVRAQFERSRKDFEPAGEHFTEARMQTEPQREPYRYAQILSDEAGMLLEQGNAELAVKRIKKAIEVLGEAFGDSHVEVGDMWSFLGTQAAGIPDGTLAREAYGRALAIYVTSGERTSRRLGNIHFGVARLDYDENRYEQALFNAEAAQRHFVSTLPEKHRRLGDIANLLGVLHQELGDYPQAELAFKRAAMNWRPYFRDTDPEMLALQLNGARLLHQRGNASAALHELRLVTPEVVKALGESHPFTRLAIRAQAEVLTSVGRYSEASKKISEVITLETLGTGAAERSETRLLQAYLFKKLGVRRKKWSDLADESVHFFQTTQSEIPQTLEPIYVELTSNARNKNPKLRN